MHKNTAQLGILYFGELQVLCKNVFESSCRTLTIGIRWHFKLIYTRASLLRHRTKSSSAKYNPVACNLKLETLIFSGWGSLVVGILGCTLICSASVAILVRRIDFTASTPHLHQLRPVPILQSASTIEPISMHVHSNSLGREHSNRQVRIRDPNPVQDGRRSQNGSVATRQSSNSSASRTNKTSVKRGRVPRQERSHHSRGRPEKGPSDAQSTQSASRAKRRRSYEASLERARSAPGQVKQYV